MQVVIEKDGRYKPFPPDSGWSGFAYNTMESNNQDEGEQGSGDQLDGLPGYVGLVAIGRDAVIQGAQIFVTEAGSEAYFAVPNNIGGSCEG